MSKNNVKLVGLLLLVFLIVLLAINFNFYKSEIASSQTASIGISTIDNQAKNYHIEFEYAGERIHSHDIIHANAQETTNIVVEIEDFVYEGLYFIPLYRKFTMNYQASFTSDEKDEINSSVEGDIEGSIDAMIVGLVSTTKAKNIVEHNAIESIKKYLIESLL